jgi:hypothetical protein
MPLTCITHRHTTQPVPKNPVTDEKAIVSYRLSFRLTDWVKEVSSARGWSMNEYVARVLEGLRDWWFLPKMIADVLEADRKAMGMDEYDYIGHLLATRYNEIRDKGGPGFEKKKGFSSKK